MKKIKKLLGLLVLSSMIVTGCDEKKIADVINNSSNVSENNNGENNNENNNNDNNENNSGEENNNDENNGENTNNNGSEYGEGNNNGEGGNNNGEGGGNQGENNGQGENGNGGENNKTEWDNEEKAIFADYFYGVEVPYMYIEGETPLDVNLTYGYAYKTAPNCSAELLDSYAELFDETWIDLNAEEEEEDVEFGNIDSGNVLSAPRFDDGSDDDDYDLDFDYELATYYEYNFCKIVTTEEGTRFVYVSIYGGEEDEDGDVYTTSDGSGTFNLEIYDPYFYEWPAEEVEYVLEILELTDEVPAFDGADYYEIDDSWFFFGVVMFYCYTDDDNSITTYIEDLMAVGYELYETDQYGWLYYTTENKEISIGVAYDPDGGSLIIMISPYYEEEEKEDWTDAEKAIFDEVFYGIEVPYQYFPGEEDLEYIEDNGLALAFKYCEEVTPELLASYYAMFDGSWFDDSEPEDNYFYLEKKIETDDGFRIVCVEFYAADDNGLVVESGEGALYFMVYEPYYYEWPTEFLAEIYEDFELTSTIPVFDADYYYCNENELNSGYLALYCYTDSETAEADYLAVLTAAGFTLYETDDEGNEYYADENEEFTISFAYDESYGDLDIYVEIFGAEVVIDADIDSLTRETFGIADITNDAGYYDRYATGASGVEYHGHISAGTGIQLKSKGSVSGIVSTTSGGTLLSITVAFNKSTAANQELQIYASNEPFDIAEMYKTDSEKCEYVGSIKNNGSGDTFVFEGEYKYIGIRSEHGAIYLDEIIIVWDSGEEPEENPLIDGFDNPEDNPNQ